MNQFTICTDSGARLVLTPSANGEKLSVGITVNLEGKSVHLTADQAGAFVFGVETMMEVMEARRDTAKREAAEIYAAKYAAKADKVQA